MRRYRPDTPAARLRGLVVALLDVGEEQGDADAEQPGASGQQLLRSWFADDDGDDEPRR